MYVRNGTTLSTYDALRSNFPVSLVPLADFRPSAHETSIAKRSEFAPFPAHFRQLIRAVDATFRRRMPRS
jgi:hypothetical protein